ncbi:MAG: hypothetical protein ACKO45_04520 [Cyanobium sp.]
MAPAAGRFCPSLSARGFRGVEGDQGRRAAVGDGVISVLFEMGGDRLAEIPRPLQRQLGQQLLF